MAVGTASDYAALLKEYQTKQANVKRWEDIFIQPYQTAAEQVTAQTQYDISGAFAQYKKSQLNAMQNMRLGSGFKEQIASDLASQYGSAYSQLRQEEMSQIGQIQKSYLQQLAEQEELLLESGEKFAEVERALYDYMGISDTNKLEEAYNRETGGLGFFELTENGEFVLTDRGRLNFDKALNYYYNATEEDKGQLFKEYLAEQNPELSDWYLQHFDEVNQLVGGLTAGDISYSTTDKELEEAFSLAYDYRDYIDPSRSRDIEYLRHVKRNIEKINAIPFNNAWQREDAFRDLLDPVVKKPNKGEVDSIGYSPNEFKVNKNYMTKENIELFKQLGFKQDKYNDHVLTIHLNDFEADIKRLFIELTKLGVL